MGSLRAEHSIRGRGSARTGATGGNILNEREIWAASERLDLLFSLLPPGIQLQRANSHLRSLTSEYMDYITRSDLVSDTKADEIGRAILGVFRVVTSIESLYGRQIDSDIKSHTLFQEVERLFNNSEHQFQGPEFTLFTAAHIKNQTQEPIAIVPESGKRCEKTPDLCLPGLCYLECKDLVTESAENIVAAMGQRLQDAARQLCAARQRDPALAGGVALDLPLKFHQPDANGSCPAIRDAHATAAGALTAPGVIDFILLSFSGFDRTATDFTWPYRLAVYAREGLPDHLFVRLFSRLGERGFPKPQIYIVCPDRQREYRIRDRAFFLWENKSGSCWSDPIQNWLEAEKHDDRSSILGELYDYSDMSNRVTFKRPPIRS